jgi:hypothetical protein
MVKSKWFSLGNIINFRYCLAHHPYRLVQIIGARNKVAMGVPIVFEDIRHTDLCNIRLVKTLV